MRRLLLSITAISLLAVAAAGQRGTYDITGYTAPKGWTKTQLAHAVQFMAEDASQNAACVIMLFKSMPGTGDAAKDFNSSWDSIVRETLSIKASPKVSQTAAENGWTGNVGVAQYDNNGSKALAMLFVLSSGNRMIPIAVLTNTDIYGDAVSEFVGSLKLPHATASRTPPTTATPSSANNPLLMYKGWKQSQYRSDGMGGSAGRAFNVYEFRADGTYTFYAERFQYYTPKYYLENESGTYRVSGDRLTLSPKRSVFSQHRTTKEEQPIKSGNLGLESVEYTFQIIDENGKALLLSPVSGQPTRRDGGFSYMSGGRELKAYKYAAIDYE